MIVAFDSVAVLASALALAFLLLGKKEEVGADIRALLALLLITSSLHLTSIWSEWAGITNKLEGIEDFSGAVLPMFWAFLFYAWIQRGLQAELRRSEEDLRVTLDSIGDAVIATDTRGCVTRMNREAERLTGWSLHEGASLPLTEVFPIFSALDGSRSENPVDRVLATGVVVALANHTQLQARDESRTHIADSAAPIRDGDDQIVGVVLVFRDVSEDYELRMQLIEKEERLELALEGAGLGTWDWDVPGGKVTCDARWAAMLGEEPMKVEPTIETFEERIHPEDRTYRMEALQAHLEGRTDAYESEHRLATREGGWCWVLDRGRVTLRDEAGRPLRVSGTHLDRSDRKLLEESMQNRAKLEAVGRLAGGVAHDLNNLLTPILGYSDLLATSKSTTEEDRDAVDQIIQAGWSARDLVGRLLAFGRRQHLRVQPLNLNEVISNFENLIKRTVPENIQVGSELAPHLPSVLADAGQVEQILMNLAVNAADAMPSGGSLEIRTSKSQPSEVTGKESSYVRLSIQDTGCGMDKDVRDRAFEPFFSTKGDQGSGLGLATVYGIVQQHHGLAHVESAPGKGTTFEILLPIVEESVVEQSLPEPSRPPDGQGETVLLVDDDEMVRRIAKALLRHLGYQVLTARDGAEALQILLGGDSSVDLLLTDMMMPGLSGQDLLEEARRTHPGLRVLFMSGYDESTFSGEETPGESRRLLMKPFSTKDLARMVREALHEPPDPLPGAGERVM